MEFILEIAALILLLVLLILSIVHHQKISKRLCLNPSVTRNNEIFISQVRFRPDISRKEFADYQSFQVDLLNRISIVGKLSSKTTSTTSTTIKQINFKIFEATSCVKYQITDVSYRNCNDKNDINERRHAIKFNIEEILDKGKSQSEYTFIPTPDQEMVLRDGDSVFSEITGDSRLRTEKFSDDKLCNPKLIPPRICQGTVSTNG